MTEPRTVELVIETNFSLVNARRSMHWGQRAAEDARLRNEATILALRARPRPPLRTPVRISAKMAQSKGITPDADAIAGAVKPIVDGLVDGGLIADDTRDYVAAIEYLAADRGPQRNITITITEANP